MFGVACGQGGGFLPRCRPQNQHHLSARVFWSVEHCARSVVSEATAVHMQFFGNASKLKLVVTIEVTGEIQDDVWKDPGVEPN